MPSLPPPPPTAPPRRPRRRWLALLPLLLACVADAPQAEAPQAPAPAGPAMLDSSTAAPPTPPTGAGGGDTTVRPASAPDAGTAGGAPDTLPLLGRLAALPPGTGVPDSLDVARVADTVVHLVRDRRWAALAALVHPERGLRFSPYGYVDTATTVQLSPRAVAGLGESDERRRWGTEDGSGRPIVLPFSAYYDEWLYDKPYAAGTRGAPGELVESGNARVNIDEVFGPSSTVVAFHVPGTDEFGGLNWGSLRTVFARDRGRWWLVGLVNGRWTI